MSQGVHVVCPSCNGVNRVPADRLGEGPRCGKCRGALFEGRPVELVEGTFDTLVGRTDLTVIVDFWAPWCGPCRSMAPAFARAAAELEPAFRLAKVDTEAEPGLAGRFGVRSIPTLIAFRGGREVARRAGALDAGTLVAWARAAAGG